MFLLTPPSEVNGSHDMEITWWNDKHDEMTKITIPYQYFAVILDFFSIGCDPMAPELYKILLQLYWTTRFSSGSNLPQTEVTWNKVKLQRECVSAVSPLLAGESCIWATLWIISGTCNRSNLSPLLFYCQLSHLIPLPSDPCCALSVNTSSGLRRQFYLRSDAETSDRLLLSVWTTNTAIMKVVEKAKTHNLVLFQAERLCLEVYGKEALWACTSIWQPIWVTTVRYVVD